MEDDSEPALDPMPSGDEGHPRGGLPSPAEEALAEAEERARRWARRGVLAALPVALALGVAGAPWVDVLLLPVLLVTLPAFAVAQACLLGVVEVERLPAYLSSILAMGVLAGCCLAAAAFRGDGGSLMSFLGVVAVSPGELVGWSAALTASGLALMGLFRVGAGWFGLREQPFLQTLLPRSAAEKTAFLGVSLSAGVGEELVFRGYVLGALVPLVGVPWAVGLSSTSFGVIHAYQGWVGFLRTGLLGGLLAWGYLASGSLLPAMVAHTLLDVVAGIFLGDVLMVPDDDSRV